MTQDLLQATAVANADLRGRIFTAMAAVESMLENDTDFVGESRDKGRRFLIVAPLSITYEINAKSRIVTILQASVYSPRE